jgi:hypothetical protein
MALAGAGRIPDFICGATIDAVQELGKRLRELVLEF